MLIADQGFGDGIQFCRYIPWAAQRCCESGGGVQPRAAADDRPGPGHRHDVRPLGRRRRASPICRSERPAAPARDAAGQHPRRHRALSASRTRRGWRTGRRGSTNWRRRGTAASAWCGPAAPPHRNDRNRSVALSRLSALTRHRRRHLGVAAEGTGRARSATISASRRWSISAPRSTDFTDTLAIMEGLDLVVTVDTAVGHLAGAMGKRGVDPAALRSRLALAAEPRRHPLVPHRPPVPAV